MYNRHPTPIKPPTRQNNNEHTKITRSNDNYINPTKPVETPRQENNTNKMV